MVQLGVFLGRLLPPLKTGLPLMKNVLKPLAERVLIPLGLIVAASAAVAIIHKKILGSGMTTLIMSNEEMDDIMKRVKSHEEPDVFIKVVSQTIKNEAKE